MRQQAEQRTEVLSMHNDSSFLPMEITVAQIDPRSCSLELVRWISGEEVSLFSLSAHEMEALIKAYRAFLRARPSLLAALRKQDHEEEHHFLGTGL